MPYCTASRTTPPFLLLTRKIPGFAKIQVSDRFESEHLTSYRIPGLKRVVNVNTRDVLISVIRRYAGVIAIIKIGGTGEDPTTRFKKIKCWPVFLFCTP